MSRAGRLRDAGVDDDHASLAEHDLHGQPLGVDALGQHVDPVGDRLGKRLDRQAHDAVTARDSRSAARWCGR